MGAGSILFIDLNNSARFPSLSIGYLIAGLRNSGFDVDVLSPMAVGVPGYERDEVDTYWSHLKRRAFFSSHFATLPFHNLAHWAWKYARARPNRRTIEATRVALSSNDHDVLLVSAYLENYFSVVTLGKIAAKAGIPLVVGGPAFNFPGTAEQWLGIPGLTAIVASEMDVAVGDFVNTVIAGGDLTRFPGIFLPDGRSSKAAAPLQTLGDLPVPDFTDFPWNKYASPVIPVMTGRGCAWGRCLFCSDVTSVNGRTFRSLPLKNVLEEMGVQSSRHNCKDIFFVDLKLNSDLEVWRGIISNYQEILPDGRWAAMVHVDNSNDNGLSSADLRAARASGMTRISFGLESGSQRLLQRMAKGTTVGRMSQFLKDAASAGLSTRATMIIGYPGETADDLEKTNHFVSEHSPYLDRIRVSRFAPIPGTPFAKLYEQTPHKVPGVRKIEWRPRFGSGAYRYQPARSRHYRKQKAKLLWQIYKINREEVPSEASAFNGIM